MLHPCGRRMRFKKDELVVERRYRLEPSLLKEGAVPGGGELTLVIPGRSRGNDFGQGLLFLSAVTERMWNLLTRGETLDAIVKVIADEYEVDPGRAREDLMGLVDELRARHALVPAES